MTHRRLVAPQHVLSTLSWTDKTIAALLLDQAMSVNQSPCCERGAGMR
jgi:hypothetical protein